MSFRTKFHFSAFAVSHFISPKKPNSSVHDSHTNMKYGKDKHIKNMTIYCNISIYFSVFSSLVPLQATMLKS